MNKNVIVSIGIQEASKILNIPLPEVFFASSSDFPNQEISSIYRHKDNEIIFNEDWVNRSNELEIMITTLHETRHAYQKACADFQELINHDSRIVDSWSKEFEDYKNPNFSNYLEQNIEKDAIEYSNKMIKDFINSLKE